MDWKEIAKALGAAANAAAVFIPQAALVGPAIAIGERILDAIDELTNAEPESRSSEELAVAQRELRKVVSAKAQAEADRLDGGDDGA